ncbi:MAG: NACHT domain-containing protein [Methylobacter sp.]|nr:NACHT domain-containing protein [Methylobacter sp.]
MSNMYLYGLIVALSIISLSLLIWIIYLKYKSKYTREKYAFASLIATTSLASLGVTSVLYQTPWAAIINLVAFFTGAPVELKDPSWSEQALIILFIGYVIWIIQRTFSQWNGEISINQYEQQKRHEEVFFPSEGWQELQRKLKGTELKIYNPIDYNQQVSALDVPSDNLAWRIQAIELLTLRWHGYYRFEIENDENWHERAHCWLGKNVKQNKTTAVFCCRQDPRNEEIKAFVDYVHSLGNELNQCELMIIVQQGDAQMLHSIDSDIEIQQYSEAWLLNGLIDFEDYFLDLKKRVEFDCLPDSNLVLPDIYVPSAILGEDASPIEEDLEAYLSKWLVEPGQRQLALLGEYGQGKSTGTLMFSHKLVEQYKGKSPRIPILVELRGKSPKTLQPLELLSVWASNYRIDPKALMKLQQAGRLLLIFEGFDEMAEVSDAEARSNHFRSLWRFCYPKAKILITGRPNFFLDDRELKSLLGIDCSIATGAYVQALHLQPFSQAQIAHSLRNATVQNRLEITQLAKDDIKFYDIASRPSLLYIVNQLWNKSELKDHKHDMNSALVIGLFIQHSYKRQTEKIRDGKQFMILNESEREYFMDGIAAYMATEKLPNQITLADFNQIIEKLYEKIPDEVSLQGSALNSSVNKPLKLRLKDNDDPLETVKTDVRTCGVLVKDLTRSNTLKFPHKSFLEYLFANYAVKRLMDKNDASAAAIWAVTRAKPEDLLNMLESLEFAGELLQNKDQIKKLAYTNIIKLQSSIFNILFETRLNSENINHFNQKLIIVISMIFNFDTFIRKRRGNASVVRLTLLIMASLTVLSSLLVMSILEEKFNTYELNGHLFTWIILPVSFYAMIKFKDSIDDLLFSEEKTTLWLLLSVILGVKYKDIELIFGKTIANRLPQLATNVNADHLLEKYSYRPND